MPEHPTMSFTTAQHDQELAKQRQKGELMYVSKDRNIHGDIYIESDAEEIYLPDGTQ